MPKLAEAENFSVALKALAEDDYSDLIDALDPNIPRLQPEHLISHLFVKQNDSDFAKLFDAMEIKLNFIFILLFFLS